MRQYLESFANLTPSADCFTPSQAHDFAFSFDRTITYEQVRVELEKMATEGLITKITAVHYSAKD